MESVPGDESTLFLRTTFGILVSRDAGQSWRWICERALGYEGQWDPPIVVTKDGKLWVGLEDGLSWTREGCAVEAVPELQGHTIKDLTTDPRGETVWAITGAPGKKAWVWRRKTGGRFERLAGFDEINLMTIEVAPSAAATRVFLSGQPYTTIRGQIWRSDDGGASFATASSTPVVPREAGASSAAVVEAANTLAEDGPMFIGAIDPLDKDRLVVRHLHANGSDVLLSRDGGRTFTNVLSMKSAMYGFAHSPDGKVYWAGSGLPEDGVFRSIDRGERFERVSQHGVLCLHAAGKESGALFICDNALTPGAPVVSVSRDQGRSITSLLSFPEIGGPVSCASPDARVSLCAGSWAETRSLLLPSDGGKEGAEVDAGRRPKRDRRDGGTSSATPAPTPARSSCGCQTPTRTNPIRWLEVACAAVLVWGCRRLMRGSKLTQLSRNCSTWQQGAPDPRAPQDGSFREKSGSG
jgi:hypothetical protein